MADKEKIGNHIKSAQAKSVPPQLRLAVTPAEIKAAKQRRDEVMATQSTLALRSPEQKRMGHAIGIEETRRVQLEDDRFNEEERKILRKQLAASLIAQGRLDEALELSPEDEHLIRPLIEAINRPDDEECDCIENGFPLDAVGRIFSIKHGGEVYLTTCANCGFMNARPTLRPALLALEEARVNKEKISDTVIKDRISRLA